ncbi:MAG: response regulator [Nitrospirae bacterium]|nr:MAG: response regulator [Nitrospirota bacterium]
MSRPLRILIVEDSEDDTQLLLHELRRGGYDPMHERVESAAAMDRALARQQWDMVIADYSIPNFNSTVALALLKERGHDLPFIIVSGTITEETAVATMKAGAHDYLLKGNLKRLIPAIDRELREAASRRERRKAEEALRESEKRLQKILDNSPAIIFLKDTEGRYLYVNPQFGKLTVLTPEQILGKTDAEIFPPEQAAAFRANDLKVLQAGVALEFEEVARHQDELYTSIVSKFPLRNTEGEVYAICGIATDITERKSLEAQLRQSQKMEAIGRLAGGIAHDFNNMLTVINGFSELMLLSLPVGDPHRNTAEHIRQAGEKAATLTRHLLAFSRQQVLQPRVLDLNAVVANMDTMLKRMIAEDIDLLTILSPGSTPVKADPGQIQQILMNLVVNARDAMPDGGRLTIETADVVLDTDYARRHVGVSPGRYVMLAVSDNGCGMDKQTQARIFEPFFTTKEEGKGTGLGLSTVYGIVKQSGGNIWVYSEPGRGTTFRIYLPRIEGVAEAIVPGKAQEPLPRGSETLLLVEDDAGVRKLAKTTLQTQGYTVLEAAQGEDAVRLSGQHEGLIHLMVTDMVMPEMSGRELAERLKPLRPNMKVLLTSGYTGKAMLHHGELDPGMAFLQKPFTPQTLARKVREVLDAD